MDPRTRTLLAALALALAGPLAACTVGPDFEPPEAPSVTRYTAAQDPLATVAADTASGLSQRFSDERDLPAEWWSLFASPQLDALVRQALDANPALAQAEARLVRAQEGLRARTGATKYPTVDASASIVGVGVESDAVQAGTVAESLPLTLAFASVGVGYSLDLFGRNRRELEALRAGVDFERFQLEAARLMLAGNVVTAAIEVASLRQQIQATEALVAVQARRVAIVEQLARAGSAPELDVVGRQGELAETRAPLPHLQRRLEQTRHRLAIYLGRPPGAAQIPELGFEVDLRLPTDLPLSLPSELARRRPDVRAAEALLHEACARVGMAEASFYPQIALSATGGFVSVDDLLDGTPGFSLLSASITQPLFRGGELRAREREARAAFEQAGAAYREVVLSALQEVADVLVALDADARTLRERAEVARLAAAAHAITRRDYESGGASLLALLEAEQRQLAASVEVTRAVASRFADTAALFQALGGGWWNTEDGSR